MEHLIVERDKETSDILGLRQVLVEPLAEVFQDGLPDT